MDGHFDQATVSSVLPINSYIEWLSENEQWACIPGWPAYRASSRGRICRNGRILSPFIKDGRQFVSLCRDCRKKDYRVHRLVALAFLGDPPFEGAIVAHNDGNPLNNKLNNLRWCSHRGNAADMKRHKTVPPAESAFQAKISEDDVRTIKARLAAGETSPAIAKDYPVSDNAIRAIKNGKTWRHVQL